MSAAVIRESQLLSTIYIQNLDITRQLMKSPNPTVPTTSNPSSD
jgi:hypothetical protein